MTEARSKPICRQQQFDKLRDTPFFDIAVIGGGATGVGVALEAAIRGFRVLLVEKHDIAKGTSSRATKLVHGGVRYLAQGNFKLVAEALRERHTILRNAPHLSCRLGFVVPAYSAAELVKYAVGLKLYDLVAGRSSLGATRLMGRKGASRCAPGVLTEGLVGAVQYWDGQFDDARLALAIARTAVAHGATVVNYCQAENLLHSASQISGVTCRDVETGAVYPIRTRCVVNAAGVWADEVRALDPSLSGNRCVSSVRPSQGTHVVVDRSFWPSEDALLIPSSDGRVLFAVPWLGQLLLGTTDRPRMDAPIEPAPTRDEIDFILEEVGRYLASPPTREHIKSVWAGLRPLAAQEGSKGANSTSAVSREHRIDVSRSGLVTITGGKWTTYRSIAQHAVEICMESGLLAQRPGDSSQIALIGACEGPAVSLAADPGYHLYGSEETAVRRMPGAEHVLARGLTEAMVRFAARYELARTVEDVLARRSRLLFLDATAAHRAAPAVSGILCEETGRPPELLPFLELARQFGARQAN